MEHVGAVILSSLVGVNVDAVSFEYGIRLHFADKSFLYVEEPFTVTRDGLDVLIDPQTVSDNSGLVLGVLDDSVNEARILSEGQLWVDFAGGTTFFVPVSMQHDSWTFGVTGVSLFISPPGGEIQQFDE